MIIAHLTERMRIVHTMKVRDGLQQILVPIPGKITFDETDCFEPLEYKTYKKGRVCGNTTYYRYVSST
jgi:hypothetical protein